MPSQKKLNTYGVESPCERLPGVGSFLANPGLSKEQLVELRGGNLYIAKFIHWNNGTIPTQLRDKTIVRVAWLIIKGEIV